MCTTPFVDFVSAFNSSGAQFSRPGPDQMERQPVKNLSVSSTVLSAVKLSYKSGPSPISDEETVEIPWKEGGTNRTIDPLWETTSRENGWMSLIAFCMIQISRSFPEANRIQRTILTVTDPCADTHILVRRFGSCAPLEALRPLIHSSTSTVPSSWSFRR